jgi:hypothetical protein
MVIDIRISRIHETHTQHKSCASKGIKAYSRKHQRHYTSHRAQGQPSTSHAHPRASKHIVGSTSHTTQAQCKSQCSPSVTAQPALGYIMLSATKEVAAAMVIDSRISRIHETQTQHKSCASKGIKAYSRKHQPHYTSHRAQGQPSTSHAHPRALNHIVGSTSHTTKA